MTISIFDVKALLKERRQMTVQDVSYHFRVPEGMAEMMLRRLEQKGLLRELTPQAGACGGGCCSCHGRSPVFRWCAKD